jgi:hypothetical protein
MSLLDVAVSRPDHPVDIVEGIASANNWMFERSGEDEITISVDGGWTDYHVSFQWMDDIEALHLACAFDLKTPDRRRGDVLQLLALVNEQMFVGHFDLWRQEGVIVFRHALLLAGGAGIGEGQCEALLSTAVEACERYYQAFQFVVWAGRPAAEALEGVLFETAGEA